MTQPHPPGWYPDPQRAELSRYWDGQQWTDQARDANPEGKKRSLRYLGIIGVIVAALVVWMVVANGSDDDEPANANTGPSIDMLEIKAKVACSMALERTARDPDSVEYRDVSVVPPPELDGLWIVVGEVNAANAIGGMTGFQPYRCEARYDAASEEMRPVVTAPA